MHKKLLGLSIAAALVSSAANATTVTYNDIVLGSGLTVVTDGVTLAATTNDGSLGNISAGTFAGLYIGQAISSLGTYSLTFSEAITSILVEFDALSSVGGDPAETLFGFSTNNGPILISYTNQDGTTFDGSTITSTANDGQGIIEFVGAAFTQFIFTHAQNPSQNGFVIERIVINTADSGPVVPLPPALALFLTGAAALAAKGRKRKLGNA